MSELVYVCMRQFMFSIDKILIFSCRLFNIFLRMLSRIHPLVVCKKTILKIYDFKCTIKMMVKLRWQHYIPYDFVLFSRFRCWMCILKSICVQSMYQTHISSLYVGLSYFILFILEKITRVHVQFYRVVVG